MGELGGLSIDRGRLAVELERERGVFLASWYVLSKSWEDEYSIYVCWKEEEVEARKKGKKKPN